MSGKMAKPMTRPRLSLCLTFILKDAPESPTATGKYCPAEFSRDRPTNKSMATVARPFHEEGEEIKRKGSKLPGRFRQAALLGGKFVALAARR